MPRGRDENIATLSGFLTVRGDGNAGMEMKSFPLGRLQGVHGTCILAANEVAIRGMSRYSTPQGQNMNRQKALLVLALFVCAWLVIGDAHAATVPVAPNAAFLRASAQDTPAAPAIFDLATLGFSAGEVLLIDQLGDWAFRAGLPETNTVMLGVFSSSSTILSQNNLNRVPGAIDAGLDVFSEPTFNGALPTDIAEDFRVDPQLEIAVPAGAQFLFVGVRDSFYGDNLDIDRDLAVSVSSRSVPEPSLVLLLLSGAAALGLVRRKR
jgi:hypothetical protein